MTTRFSTAGDERRAIALVQHHQSADRAAKRSASKLRSASITPHYADRALRQCRWAY